MEIYKVILETTNATRNKAMNKNNNRYLDVIDGAIYVSKKDLDFIMQKYKFISIEFAGLVFERPIEIDTDK